MGSFMATNLVNADFPLTVWNRTPGRSDALVALGALQAPSPAQLARSCDVVVACLTDSPQVEEGLFCPDRLAGGFSRSEEPNSDLPSPTRRSSDLAPSPAHLARSCDVVVACLTDSPQVEEVLFGPDGLAEGFSSGSLFIDCSTI